jgi:hypothetical protein
MEQVQPTKVMQVAQDLQLHNMVAAVAVVQGQLERMQVPKLLAVTVAMV